MGLIRMAGRLPACVIDVGTGWVDHHDRWKWRYEKEDEVGGKRQIGCKMCEGKIQHVEIFRRMTDGEQVGIENHKYGKHLLCAAE